MSPFTLNVYNDLRAIVPSFAEDTTKYKEIRAMENYLRDTKIDLSKI
jgi:hypothetical protein